MGFSLSFQSCWDSIGVCRGEKVYYLEPLYHQNISGHLNVWELGRHL